MRGRLSHTLRAGKRRRCHNKRIGPGQTCRIVFGHNGKRLHQGLVEQWKNQDRVYSQAFLKDQ